MLDLLVSILFRVLTAVAVTGFFLMSVFAIVYGILWALSFITFPSPNVVSWSEMSLQTFSVLT